MPGRGSLTREVEVTPDRRTHVVYDVSDRYNLNPEYGRVLGLKDLAYGSGAKMDGVVFLSSIGIRLDYDPDAVVYDLISDGADEGVFDTTTAHIPTDWKEVTSWRTKAELPGAFATSPFPATKGKWFRKKVPAGTSWDSTTLRLATDQTAFPGPSIYDDNATMDRVLTGKGPHEAGQPLTFNVIVHGDKHQKGVALFVAYFCGPAGWDNEVQGYGQYAAVVYSGSEIVLFERGLNVVSNTIGWNKRALLKFPGISGSLSTDTQYFLTVNPVVSGSPRKTRGTIRFALFQWGTNIPDDASPASRMVGMLGRIAEEAFSNSGGTNVYRPPSQKGVSAPTTPVPVRLDFPRTFRGYMRVKRLRLRTTGKLKGTLITVPDGAFLYEKPLRIEWYADRPTSTDVTLELLDTSFATITPSRTGFVTGGGYAEFDFTASESRRQFIANFTLTGDGWSSPTLREVRVSKVATVQDYVGTDTEGGRIQSFSSIGAGSDPTTESAGWRVTDLGRSIDLLTERNSMPVAVDIEYDPADPTKRVRVFQGYVEEALASRRRKRGKAGRAAAGPDHPHPIAYGYDVRAIGMWNRLSEMRSTTMFSFAIDPDGGLDENGNAVPYRVTTAIRAVLKRCGFDDDRVSIADNEIRLFPVIESDQSLYAIRPLADLAQVIQQLARDYLGAALVYDPMLNTNGAWTLVYPPRAPYTNVAYFTTAGPGAGKVFSLASYAAKVIAEGSLGGIAHLGSTVPQVPVVKLLRSQKRPVCNKLIVSGEGKLETSPTSKLTVSRINPDSWKYRADAPCTPDNNPDWLGREVPFWYLDTMLQYSAAVKFVANRLFEVLCKGYTLYRIYGPLQFIDHTGAPGKKRCLRFGDPVILFDGENEVQCIVRSCSIDIISDATQMATYEPQQVRV